MFPSNEFTLWLLKAFAYAAFAAFGGTVSYLLKSIDSQVKISWGRAAIQAASAGFVGVLVLLGCQAGNVGEQWTGLIVGVSGWLGADATIKILEAMVRRKLGIDGGPDGNKP